MQTSPLPNPADAPLDVGQMLREAREAAGLSLHRAAERLHIRARYLEAIEAERYDALPGTTYLLGYVGAYARFLGMDAERLTAAVRTRLSPPPPIYTVVPPGRKETKPSREVYILSALLTVLICLVWRVMHPLPAPPVDTIIPPSATMLGLSQTASYAEWRTALQPSPPYDPRDALGVCGKTPSVPGFDSLLKKDYFRRLMRDTP